MSKQHNLIRFRLLFFIVADIIPKRNIVKYFLAVLQEIWTLRSIKQTWCGIFFMHNTFFFLLLFFFIHQMCRPAECPFDEHRGCVLVSTCMRPDVIKQYKQELDSSEKWLQSIVCIFFCVQTFKCNAMFSQCQNIFTPARRQLVYLVDLFQTEQLTHKRSFNCSVRQKQKLKVLHQTAKREAWEIQVF